MGPQEGIEAKRKGVQLHAFGLEQYKVPYGYSPLLVTHSDTIRCGEGARVVGGRAAIRLECIARTW